MLNMEEYYNKYSIALTGCRATKLAYECCEYDLIILEDCKEGVEIKEDKYIEIHKISNDNRYRTLQLYNAVILNDPSFILSALKNSLTYDLRLYSRDLLLDALLDASKAMTSNGFEASFLLKRAAYNYLNSLLLLNKVIPSPLHILTQLRELRVDLTMFYEPLGLERANSSSLIRALDMLYKLINSRLISRKALYLYEIHKYVDCSLYITYLAIKLAKDGYHDILPSLAILLDLTNDVQNTERLASILFKMCKELMKSY
ncbi:MAG: hypothetical protein QW416_03040 [Candidatus Nitrosocaldaceae archaeon]